MQYIVLKCCVITNPCKISNRTTNSAEQCVRRASNFVVGSYYTSWSREREPDFWFDKKWFNHFLGYFYCKNWSMFDYSIRTLVFLYNYIDRNWSIFFNIGCVKMHVTWYRVCRQKWTTFVLLLFTIIDVTHTKSNNFRAFSSTLFLQNQSIYILVNVTGILLRWAFYLKTSLLI